MHLFRRLITSFTVSARPSMLLRKSTGQIESRSPSADAARSFGVRPRGTEDPYLLYLVDACGDAHGYPRHRQFDPARRLVRWTNLLSVRGPGRRDDRRGKSWLSDLVRWNRRLVRDKLSMSIINQPARHVVPSRDIVCHCARGQAFRRDPNRVSHASEVPPVRHLITSVRPAYLTVRSSRRS